MLASLCLNESATFTPEQRDAIEYFVHCSSSLFIEARAGTGKTFALIEMASRVPPTQECAFFVFNAHVVDEIKNRLQAKTRSHSARRHVITTYALGKRMLSRKFGKLNLDEEKYPRIINERCANEAILSSMAPCSVSFRDQNFFRATIKRWVDLFRVNLVENSQEMAMACRFAGVFYHPVAFSIVNDIVDEGVAIFEKEKTIDYIDMIYLPIRMNLPPLKLYDCVFIDEFQDYSIAQYKLARKHLFPMGKIVFVGDPYQSIYEFNGARSDLIEKAEKQNVCRKFKFTVTFRCSKKIAREANHFVDDIVPHFSVPEGEATEGSVTDAQPGDWALCKYNFPLFKLFLDNAKKRKKSFFNNKEYGELLFETALLLLEPHWSLDIMKETCQKKIEELFAQWSNEQIQTDPFLKRDFLEKLDVYKSLNFFIDGFDQSFLSSKEEFRKRFMKPFNESADDAIVLSTIHKAKGKENDVVYLIVHAWETVNGTKKPKRNPEDINLNYVAITRARKKLVYDFRYFSKVMEFSRNNQLKNHF